MKVKPKKGWIMPAAIWWLVVLFLLFAVVYPMAVLIGNSFLSGNKVTLSHYARVFSDPGIRVSILNSLKVVIPSTVFSTLLGVLLAWICCRTNLPGRRLWRRLLSIPYFIPPFIGAIAWTFLLGPKGIINKGLMALFGLSSAPFNIYSIAGMIFVMTVYRFAVPFIVVMPTMKKVSASFEEAARISGATPWQAVRDVTLPLLLPSILGAMLLVFMFILSDFGVSAVLGAPDRIRLMTTEIFYLINRPDLENHLQIASAYSIMLSLFALLGLFAYHRILGSSKYAVISGESAAADKIRFGKRGKSVLLVFVVLFFVLTTLAPVIASAVVATTKTYGLPYGAANFTFENFSNLLGIRNIARAFRNSAVLSVVSSVLIASITMIVSYMSVRRNARGVKGVRFMEMMVTLPYAMPGTIIALGMILAFAQPLKLTGIRLYGTFAILLIAYVARFLNLGYNNITGAMSQIDLSLEEAARISGASPMRTFFDIVVPILRSSLVGSVLLVIAPTISEISLSSLLWSVRNETIGTIVYSAQEEGKILRTAALAVVLMIFVVFINFIGQYFSERRGFIHQESKNPYAGSPEDK